MGIIISRLVIESLAKSQKLTAGERGTLTHYTLVLVDYENQYGDFRKEPKELPYNSGIAHGFIAEGF